MSQTKEWAFERCLEGVLRCSGYVPHAPQDFDRDRAIFPATAAAFIRATPVDAWARLEALHGAKTEDRVL